MGYRARATLAVLSMLVAGCGAARTVTGQASPIISARITLQPTPGVVMTKPDTDATVAVIERRLKDLGIGNFSIAAGDIITIDLAGLADLAPARLAAQRSGVVAFVPLDPNASLPPIGSFPTVKMAALLAGNEIASAAVGKDQSGNQTLEIILTPKGTEILGAWTPAHLAAPLLLLVDGQVVAAPTIVGPITAGRLTIGIPAGFPLPIAVVAAILDSGPLTAGWRQP